MVSTRGRYALRIMMDLAEQDRESPTPLKDIAQRQGISKKYLEILVKELVGAGLVTGISGKGGGYRLCRRPDDYSVGEILELMEGSMAPVSCLAGENVACPQASGCRTLPMWEEFDKLRHDFFYGKKLSDLVSENSTNGGKDRGIPENA